MAPRVHHDRIELRDADHVDVAFEGFTFASTQLGGGALNSVYDRIAFDDLVVIRNHESLARVDEYRLPDDTVGLALYKPGNGPVRWCGLEVPVDAFLLNPRNGDYVMVLPEAHEGIDIVFDRALADELGLRAGLARFGAEPTTHWIQPLGEVGEQLRSWLFHIFDESQEADAIASDPTAAAAFRTQLLDHLVRLLDRPPRRRRVRRLRRHGLVRRAHDVIVSRLDESLSTTALAANLGVSARVLQYAFHDTLDTTPHRYAVLQRLHAVRRELRRAPQTVAEVARRHGFREMGRFSGLYRRAFGELPSETQHRGLG